MIQLCWKVLMMISAYTSLKTKSILLIPKERMMMALTVILKKNISTEFQQTEELSNVTGCCTWHILPVNLMTGSILIACMSRKTESYKGMLVLSAASFKTKNARVDHSLLVQIKEKVYWRAVLKRVVAVVKFLCERGLPLRGGNVDLFKTEIFWDYLNY